MLDKKIINDRKYIRILLTIIYLLFIIIATWIIIDCFNNKYLETNEIMSYKIDNSIDYNVNYKKNEFYSEDYIPKGTHYLSTLINSIDINFYYTMKSSKLFNTNYSYSIESILVNNYIDGSKTSELLSRHDEIVPLINNQLSKTNEINIKEYVAIDYSKYNEEVLEFQEKFGIDTDSYILVRLTVKNDSNILDYNQKIIDNRHLELKVPLGKSVIYISKVTKDDIKNNICEEKITETDFNYILFIIAILMIIVSAPFLIISIASLFVIINVSGYIRSKRKYFRNNEDIIAEVETLPNLTKLEIIDVKTFDDLLDIEEELRKPILFNEIDKERESWFIIMDDKRAYRHILKAKIEKESFIGKKLEKTKENRNDLIEKKR